MWPGKGYVEYKRTLAPSSGSCCFENVHKPRLKLLDTDRFKESLADYSSTINIFYFTIIIVQGIFCWKKCTKQILNILMSIPTTNRKKSSFPSEAIFTNIQNSIPT